MAEWVADRGVVCVELRVRPAPSRSVPSIGARNERVEQDSTRANVISARPGKEQSALC